MALIREYDVVIGLVFNAYDCGTGGIGLMLLMIAEKASWMTI